MTPSTLPERVRRLLERLAGYRPGPETRSRLTAAAIAVFVIATGISLTKLPPVSFVAAWIVPMVALVFATMALNALEFHLVGRLAGIHVNVRRALVITIWSRAANLLPFPGGPLVRAHDLASDGGEWSTPARALIATGLSSLAVSLGAAGAAVAVIGRSILAAGMLASAVVFAVAVIFVLPLRGTATGAWTGGLLVLRTAFVLLGGLRFYVVSSALGFDVPLLLALAFSLSSSVASAVGIFPDGLGIRELVAGGLAPLLGIDASVGITVTALDRVASFVIVGGVAAILSLSSRPAPTRSGEPPVSREEPIAGDGRSPSLPRSDES